MFFLIVQRKRENHDKENKLIEGSESRMKIRADLWIKLKNAGKE
jgi:hypothetical protein